MFSKQSPQKSASQEASDHEKTRSENFSKEHFPGDKYDYVVYAFTFSALRSGYQIYQDAVRAGYIAICAEDQGVVRPVQVSNGNSQSLPCPDWINHIEILLEREDVHYAASQNPSRGRISSPMGNSVFLSIRIPLHFWSDLQNMFAIARMTPQLLLLTAGVKRQLPHAGSEFTEEIVTYKISLLPSED